MTGELLHSRASRVWLALVAATVLAWAIAEHAPSARIAATLVMLIAAFKVRLVIAQFMELQWRPLPWRLLFECWTIASAGMIVGGYLLS